MTDKSDIKRCVQFDFGSTFNFKLSNSETSMVTLFDSSCTENLLNISVQLARNVVNGISDEFRISGISTLFKKDNDVLSEILENSLQHVPRSKHTLMMLSEPGSFSDQQLNLCNQLKYFIAAALPKINDLSNEAVGGLDSCNLKETIVDDIIITRGDSEVGALPTINVTYQILYPVATLTCATFAVNDGVLFK